MKRLGLAALAASLWACQAEIPEPSDPAADPQAALGDAMTQPSTVAMPTVDIIPHPEMLPAHRLPYFKPLKGDQYDDIRAAAPDRYAITEAPKNAVRPMVEWEPMQAIVMAVPSYVTQGSSPSNTAGTVLGIAKNTVEISGADVWIIVESTSSGNWIKNQLQSQGMSAADLTQVHTVVEPIDSIWFIDSGPVPIVDKANNTFNFADFRYYHPRALDDGIPTWLGRNLELFGGTGQVNTYRMPLSTEGGTFQSTTDGICFTGSRQLVYMTGDGGLTYDTLEEINASPAAEYMRQVWGEYLGCEDVIVMYSITDDGTGHIDMYFKLIDDDTVLLGEYLEPFANSAQSTNAGRMDANAAYIAAYTKPDGSTFNVERLLMPGHVNAGGQQIPFTYINSTFVNGPNGKVNLWPAFPFSEWVASRNAAQAKWEELMPDYTHVWIDSTDLSFASGAIHCITRTIPALPADLWIPDGTCAGGMCSAPVDGYDGECSPNGIDYEVCYGPDWLCGCNDCTQACPEPGEPPAGCGEIGYVGCCNGSQLLYCQGGVLQTLNCQSCGWNDGANYYDCGYSGADPSGANPLSCDELTCTPSCGDFECGDDGCGGSCGTCGAGLECSGGYCVPECAPDCQNKNCGDDGCGGSCGTCGAGDVCDKGVCVADCTADCTGLECGDDGCGGSCGTCGADEFCVDGTCEASCTPDCAGKDCGDDGCGGSCGECGLGAECNPTGQCEAIEVPDCDNKECGPDGVGGSCGTCAANETCSAEGLCLCVPACSGKDCGADGCGGDCGTCAVGEACSGDQCVCVPQCEGKTCGDDGCGGVCGTCGPAQICTEGACVGSCEPDCTGKTCGDDGCGGLCGTCPGEESCVEGQCVADCTPSCPAGAECGDDGCGGTCGAGCGASEACLSNTCVCVPSCGGNECGDNGCGGSCGSCDAGWACEGGTCVEGCTPECEGKSCGGDGCGGSCGECGEGEACAVGQCVCEPSCGDAECGDNGCGGSCGACGEGEVCDAGLCVIEGCEPACEGAECGDDGCGGTCGSCGDEEECVEGACEAICVPDCVDKVCGGDGCGGECGVCEDGDNCIAGQCVPECVPACEGLACGDDGCGGSCGECEGDETCNADGQCESVDVPDCTNKECGDDGMGGSCGSCPPGQVCSESFTCEDGGAGGAGGGAGGAGGGTGGATGGAGGAGAQGGGTGGAGGTDPLVDPGSDSGGSTSDGCSGGGDGSAPAGWALMALLAMALLRRRTA